MPKNKPLVGLELRVKKGMFAALKKSSKLLEDRIKKNASETDHTLNDLEKLGHPYSAAHPKALHDPNYLVHRQSGTLLDAISTKIINQFITLVGVDEDVAPYVVHVIFGTKYMIARDFVTESLNEIQNDLRDIIEDELNKNLK